MLAPTIEKATQSELDNQQSRIATSDSPGSMTVALDMQGAYSGRRTVHLFYRKLANFRNLKEFQTILTVPLCPRPSDNARTTELG